MLRDANGDLFFGFCGVRVYVPEPPRSGELAERVLDLFRKRLAEELAKDKPSAGSKPANG